MATLGGALRFTLLNATTEAASGRFPWPRRARDQDITLEWRAETRHRQGADWVEETLAEGRMTGAEVRWWTGWFASAAAVRGFPTRLGEAPAEPVARLWTPLAGQAVEFFVWPEMTGGLALLALFTPDESRPHQRLSVETSTSPDALSAFGAALEAEYEALRAQK